MINEMTSSGILLTHIAIWTGCVVVGFITDSISKNCGLYKSGNIAILAIGCYAALHGLDYLYNHNYIRPLLRVREIWVLSITLSSTVALLLTCYLKSVIVAAARS